MPFIRNIPDDAILRDVFAAYPAAAEPLLRYHEVLLREDAPFTEAEREMIAAYVSGLNACTYCHGVHKATAERFGLADDVLDALLEDVTAAPVDDRLKPVLAYVGKLTTEPSRMTPADAEAVFAAGWSDDALFYAVSIAALFNLMNRIVEGLGIEAGPDYFVSAGERLSTHGYDMKLW